MNSIYLDLLFLAVTNFYIMSRADSNMMRQHQDKLNLEINKRMLIIGTWNLSSYVTDTSITVYNQCPTVTFNIDNTASIFWVIVFVKLIFGNVKKILFLLKVIVNLFKHFQILFI